MHILFEGFLKFVFSFNILSHIWEILTNVCSRTTLSILNTLMAVLKTSYKLTSSMLMLKHVKCRVEGLRLCNLCFETLAVFSCRGAWLNTWAVYLNSQLVSTKKRKGLVPQVKNVFDWPDDFMVLAPKVSFQILKSRRQSCMYARAV